MSGNVGFIDEEAERRWERGTYWPRLECKCGNELVGADLPEGEGKCVCGRTYHVTGSQQHTVAWIEPRPDRGGGVGG